ncbi:SDR family oxidoreductase (plasmid) [Burkholderia ambifaria]
MTNTVLITGCSSGFGKATALEFARHRWNVVATMRTPAGDTAFEAMPNVLVTQLDVQDTASIESAIASGVAQFGDIDVVVNNAGFAINSVFEAVPRDKVQELFDVNVFGVMEVTRAILKHFRAKGSGTIVNVSSGVGVFGLPLASLYNASKFAIEGFSEAISYELASLGITIKIVEPGAAPDTSFPKRSGGETAGLKVPSEYQPFIDDARRVFFSFRNGADRNAIEKVAKGIYLAATDRSDKLRYVLTDDIKPMIAARRETSEDHYIAYMRDIFPFKRFPR